MIELLKIKAFKSSNILEFLIVNYIFYNKKLLDTKTMLGNNGITIEGDASHSGTINDAINIVKGSETDGTDYLYDNTNVELIVAFKPNIKSSLKRVDATKHWKSIMKAYNKIPFVKKINPDLELYVTQKTIEGLFHILSEEEIEIRKNPQKRTSDILKKVFGNK